jgi:TolB-like protein/DNA-binding SARP family transcriptional activator
MHRPMYRLRTLGGLKLDREGSPLDAVESQRKALALLAALAVQGGLGRERLQALLWPESGPDRARGSLKQLVHVLRRQLSAPNLFLGTVELRLNPDLIASDVRDFLDALRDGRPEEAVALYEGPFLDGVHIEGGSEFERWLDGWRAELQEQWRGALEALAAGATERGAFVEAAAWWRRVQSADPLNGRIALRLMEALDAAGERGGALRHARIHELLVQEELGLPPDPAVAEMAARLRQDPRSGEASTAPGSMESLDTSQDFRSLGEPSSGPASRPKAPPSPVAPPETSSQADRAGPGTAFVAGLALTLAGVVGLGLVGPGVLGLMDRTGAPAANDLVPLDAAPLDAAPLDAALLPRAPSSLAVMPFVDLSEEGDQEYLADGITEEILVALSGIPGLRVPARNSSFYFKGRALSAPEIAEFLGVEVLLGGSLRRSGNRLRVTAHLVDAREDRLIWSTSFDEEGVDVFDAPTLVAGRVAEALRLQLAPTAPGGPGGRARVPDPLAHDHYLRGLFHWNRRSAPDLQLALRFFDEATRIDPEYGPAWAGLALAYAVLPIGFAAGLPPDEAWARLEAAASRALELDPTLAEVHAARGLSLHFAWRWEEAEAAFQRALELDPGYATAHQWYGEHLAKLGRGAEGIASIRRAIALDPLSLVAHNDLGLALMLANRLPEAVVQWEETVRMDPAFAIPHYLLHRVYLMTGDAEASAASGRRWAELSGTVSPDEIVTLAWAAANPAPGAQAQSRPRAREILDRWAREARPRYHDIAFYLVLLDEHDAALRILERGVEARHPMMAQLVSAPWVDPLRADPRFAMLLDALVPPMQGNPSQRVSAETPGG